MPTMGTSSRSAATGSRFQMAWRASPRSMTAVKPPSMSLRMPEERAVALIHAAGVGTVTTLLATSADQRDPELAVLALDAVLGVLVSTDVETQARAPASLAIGLRAHLDEATALSPGERLLLRELLDRIAG